MESIQLVFRSKEEDEIPYYFKSITSVDDLTKREIEELIIQNKNMKENLLAIVATSNINLTDEAPIEYLF